MENILSFLGKNIFLIIVLVLWGASFFLKTLFSKKEIKEKIFSAGEGFSDTEYEEYCQISENAIVNSPVTFQPEEPKKEIADAYNKVVIIGSSILKKEGFRISENMEKV